MACSEVDGRWSKAKLPSEVPLLYQLVGAAIKTEHLTATELSFCKFLPVFCIRSASYKSCGYC